MNAPRYLFASLLSTLSMLAACGGSTPTPEPVDGSAPTPTTSASADVPVASPPRREISAEDCDAKGGDVVGDIGDGAIHRPEYRCKSGSPPIGRVPLGIEGSVCCT